MFLLFKTVGWMYAKFEIKKTFVPWFEKKWKELQKVFLERKKKLKDSRKLVPKEEELKKNSSKIVTGVCS